MKKLRYILLTLIMLLPTTVLALVNDTVPILEIYDTEAQCREVLKQNVDEYKTNASTGYYLTCIKVTCFNSKITHKDLAPVLSNIKCANDNSNPLLMTLHTILGMDLESGETCDEEEFIGENGSNTLYATKRLHFNCVKTADDKDFEGAINNNTSNNNNVNNGGTTNNPQTGIETYYVVLAITIALLSFGLSVVNKRNLFKKI